MNGICCNIFRDQLKGKSKNAGSVILKATGLAATGVRQELEKLSEVNAVQVDESGDDSIEARIFPNKGKDGELSKAIFELAVEKGLTIDELRVEEGRLDELFREITLSDTAK